VHCRIASFTTDIDFRSLPMAKPPAKPRRRLLQFSLRTLLIAATLIACALGWAACQLAWIAERHEILRYALYANAGYLAGRIMEEPKPPLALRILGEPGVLFLELNWDATTLEIERARSLFPEAEISVDHGDRSPAPSEAP
jgi:hypothetical protein